MKGLVGMVTDYVTPAKNIANRLDEVRPGWEREIDQDTLDMEQPNRCLMGQLYGDFATGCKTLGIDPVNRTLMGVEVPDIYGDEGDYLTTLEYNKLTEAVLREVRERLVFDEQIAALADHTLVPA